MTSYDDSYINTVIVNSTYSTLPTDYIVEYHPCVTCPYTEYTWVWGYNATKNTCFFMSYLEVNENGGKKIIYSGENINYGLQCNFTHIFSGRYTLSQIMPKSFYNSTDTISITYPYGTVSKDPFNLSISQMNSTFDAFMTTTYRANITTKFKTFRNE